MESFREISETFSQWTIPAALLLIVLVAAWRRRPMYEEFVTGAKEGFNVAVMIIPYLVAILFVIKVFLASGMFDDVKWGARFVARTAGVSEDFVEGLDLLPLALTRPLTGSGARGVLVQVYDEHGTDSFIGQTATLMMGSTETTFYILSVYFGAVQIKRFRHTLPACLIADICGLIAAVAIGCMLFGGS
ncbi:Spore maturation protein B [Pseudobythopirellula maris]|uniref:Spore maturation protein B n=1 Tax=Pseudobythopirellula maris TaxID=2527991 RepID=A0A5C5ZIP6_9BACT|nr:spore maturation protein [Pseudobythopirellula maris]TWT87234.1 Spore maturation protein B [Pseudobythopirellula maris]